MNWLKLRLFQNAGPIKATLPILMIMRKNHSEFPAPNAVLENLPSFSLRNNVQIAIRPFPQNAVFSPRTCELRSSSCPILGGYSVFWSLTVIIGLFPGSFY
uniref:Uncharacterized protein n=1 Tax=Panagrolaimus sp. JU765 TaxID=591449 RepID=A0AC34QGD7_9BILA